MHMKRWLLPPKGSFRARRILASLMLVAFITVSLCKETLVLDRAITSIATETATKQVHSSNQLHAERDGVCGTFNNLKVAYRGQNHTLHSSAECVGESFSSDSWMYRSCMYRNLCFNVESNEFVLFQSPATSLWKVQGLQIPISSQARSTLLFRSVDLYPVGETANLDSSGLRRLWILTS